MGKRQTKQLNNTSSHIQELLGRANGCEKKLVFKEQEELHVIASGKGERMGGRASGVGGDETEEADRPDDTRPCWPAQGDWIFMLGSIGSP